MFTYSPRDSWWWRPRDAAATPRSRMRRSAANAPNWASNRQRLADCGIDFGRDALGGKGGQIYIVTDSSDRDPARPTPDTLRHAAIQTEPLWDHLIAAADSVALMALYLHAPPRIPDARDHLIAAKIVAVPMALGPESLTFNATGRGPYVSIGDGRGPYVSIGDGRGPYVSIGDGRVLRRESLTFNGCGWFFVF